jgi:starch synthase
MGLDGVLRSHAGKLKGILNGLDLEVYDPAQDPHLPAPYTREDPSGKALAKTAFREKTGLKPPILAYVGRLDFQKGLDLLQAALPRLTRAGLQPLRPGGGGGGAWPEAFREKAVAHPGRVAFHGGLPRAHGPPGLRRGRGPFGAQPL